MTEIKKSNRFEIDTKGFQTQMSEIKLHRLIQEIVANSFDEESVTKVECNIKNNLDTVAVSIVDDGKGFADYLDIFTLYKDSYKRTDPNKNGRFNLGEKQFFAVARYGYVKTGNKYVEFNGDARIEKDIQLFDGTEIYGEFVTQHTVEYLEEQLEKLIVRDGKKFFINHVEVPTVAIVKSFRDELPTVIADGKNQKMHSTIRECEIRLYDKGKDNLKPMIYELGIPVQQIDQDIAWNVDIRQKIPQTTSRDVISSAYLARLYAVIVVNTLDALTENNAGGNWVSEAMKKTDKGTSQQILVKRFGSEKIAIKSKEDYRANEMAEEAGYKLVDSGNLDRDVKANLNKQELLVYAGRDFKSDKFEFAKPVKMTVEMDWFAKVCKLVAKDTIGKDIGVGFVTTKETNEKAQYSDPFGLIWNVRNCGGIRAFEKFSAHMIGTLCHELAHDKIGLNGGTPHLSHEYLHELQRIAGIVGEFGIDYWIKMVK